MVEHMETLTLKPPVAPQVRRAAPTAVLLSALMGFVVIGIDASAVNVALPAIGRGLSGHTAGLQWIIDAYTLMFAAWLLSAGALSDRIGAGRAFQVGLAVFTIASVAGGLAPGLGILIAARLVQGVAAAIMLPSSLALVRQAFPDPARRARAIALWTMGGAVSYAAGPIAGGALTSAVSWRAIFFINVPIGLLTFVLLARNPRSERRPAALDLPGQLAAVVGLAAVTYGVIEGGSRGFGHPLVIGALIVAGVAGTAFLRIEARTAEPMVPFTLFRSRTVSVCLAVGFAVNAAFYGVIFVLSLYFQQVRHESAIVAGLMFLPMTALITGANITSAKVAARFGPKVPIAVGQLVCVAGLLGLLSVDGALPLPVIALLLIPFGVGLGFAVPSLTAAILSDLPAERAGLAAGVLNSGRQTGGALAVAVFGALVSQGDFVGGIRISLVISAVLLIVTGFAALTLPAARR
jgi:DHA2 family methylenomycin A resistance protein-like MFS transporter